MKNDRKNREGIVYSTNKNFIYNTNEPEETETLEPSKQKLKIFIDRKQRKGKSVVIISGFIGKNDDLESLGKEIKTKCGTGGSVKDGEIIIQGEMLDKVKGYLISKGFNVK
ncbi:MAG TPA: translation initiation factor [Bacteroidales bacterium]|nr:translation initiation factor [Bacteroidales bacterium]